MSSLMTPIIVPNQLDESISFSCNTWLMEYIQQQHQRYQLIYLGATWCAPCKALKPIVETLLSRYPHINAYEANFEEITDFEESVIIDQTVEKPPLLIKALPTLVLIYNNELIGTLSGLTESKDILALLDKATLEQARQADVVDSGKSAASTAVSNIEKLLKAQKGTQALDYFNALDNKVKYEPEIQQAKSLIDLTQACYKMLTHSDFEIAELPALAESIIRLNLNQALELLLPVMAKDKPVANKLYIQILNCIADKKVASHYRKLLHKISR